VGWIEREITFTACSGMSQIFKAIQHVLTGGWNEIKNYTGMASLNLQWYRGTSYYK
jgi:hypothetical protein